MYGKIYESLFTGSMVGKGAVTFSVWSYVIANTKPDSLVELNPIILATIIGTSEDEIGKAIKFLCSPDPKSRSKEHGGARLIPHGEFLYFVPQYQRYRGLPNDRARKEYFRDKQREHRQGLKDCQTDMSKNVKQAEA